MSEGNSTFGMPTGLPNIAVVAFSGELDIASKAALRERLEFFAAVPTLCLDFTNVEYMDSTVIGELVRLHKLRAERGFSNEVVVVGENQPIRRLFKILHLEALFQICDAHPDAVNATGSGVVRVGLSVRDGSLATTGDAGS